MGLTFFTSPFLLLLMDISRLKKVLAGVSASAIMLTQVGTALAAYRDVPAGSWFEEAVMAFMDAGYLDTTQANFRPNDSANRAEFVKLIVELNGGVLSTPPAVASFTDVRPGTWYYSYMEEAGKEGWVMGDNNCFGSLPCYARPSAKINRAEAAALIVRAFSLESMGLAPKFVDVATGQWYTESIMTAADHCVLQGDDSTGRVRPSDSMNRAEMVVMLHRVDQGLTYGRDCGDAPAAAAIDNAMATGMKKVEVEFTVDVDQTSAETVSNYAVTAGSSTVKVVSAKLIGDSTVELVLDVDMDSSVTYTVSVANVKSDDGRMISDSATFKGYSPIVLGNGILELSVSSKNPMGDSVPKGANGVTMLSVDLTASCDDSVQITDLTLLHGGLGATGDIDGVYGSMGGARVSRKRTLDSKAQTATLHFSSPINIAACKTVTLDLMADFTTTASTSGEHNLEVELPSDVMSNAKQVKGNFPLKGKMFRVASVTSGSMTVDDRTVSPSDVKVGDKAALIGKFEFSANSVEDQTIYSITLQNDGSAGDGDITNIRMTRADGTVLTNTATSTNGDYVTLVFNPPFVIKSSDKMTLSVIADIVGGAGDTLKMIVEETSDVFVVGSLYGFGVNGQLYGSQVVNTTASATTVTIDAGEFTLAIDGPAQQTYTRDNDAANLANIKMSTGGDEAINVRKLFIAVQGETSTGAGLSINGSSSTNEIHEVLENVVLKNKTTGRAYTGVRLTTTNSADGDYFTSATETFQIYRFDDFTVNGEEQFQFLVDFIDNGTGFVHPRDGDLFRIHVCGEPTKVSTGSNTTGCTFGGLIASNTAYQMQVEGRSTGDDVTDVRPRGTISGNKQRIAAANLTIGVKNIGASDTSVKNVKNLNIFRFEARAGEAKDVLLTKVAFAANSGSLLNGQNYTLWVDTNGDQTVDTVLQSGVTSQSSTITFSKIVNGGFVVAKEKTIIFEVHTDIAASLVENSNRNWLAIRFDTSSSSYIEAQDYVRGSSLSGINTNGTCSTTCDITVSDAVAANSKAFLLVSQGDLFVINDTVSVKNHQLLGGTVSDEVFRLQFTAKNEAIDVYALQLSVSGSLATTVNSLELWFTTGTSAFATATTSGCGSDETFSSAGNNGAGNSKTFCAKMQSSQLIVGKNSDVKVLVKANMKDDLSGATPGEQIQLLIDHTRAFNNATGSGAVRARGRDSSNDLIANDGDSVSDGEVFIGVSTPTASNTLVRGVTHYSVLSKIASIVNAFPDTGTTLSTGIVNLGMFKISAANNVNAQNGYNKVVMSGVIFNVIANNININATSFVFFNNTNPTVTSACTARNTSGGLNTNVASGSFLVDCNGLPASSVNVTVDPGTDLTFVLQGNVTNNDVTPAASSTLLVSIQNLSSIGYTALGYGSSSSTLSHFQWRDKDDSTSTTATFNWVEFPDTYVNSKSFSY